MKVSTPADKEFEQLLDSFKSWALDKGGIKPSVVKSYKTYLRKLRVATVESFGAGWFDSMLSDFAQAPSSEEIYSKGIYECLVFIGYRMHVATTAGEKKNWRDWHSAFCKLLYFLCDSEEDEVQVSPPSPGGVTCGQETVLVSKKVRTKSSSGTKPIEHPMEYSHADFVKSFKNRLNTQGRFYPGHGILFPTRVMKAIFSWEKPDAWIAWNEAGIEDMRVLLANGKVIPFSKVKKITFQGGDTGTVVVSTTEGEDVEMWTHTSTGELKKMQVSSYRKSPVEKISIDHVVPLEVVIGKNKDKLNGLRRLTDLFMEYSTGAGKQFRPRAESEWAAEFCERYREVLDTHEMREALLEDLRLIGQDWELMDGRENTRKSNRH